MIHHVHVPKTILACALLALVTAVNPASGGAEGTSATDFSWDDPVIQAAVPPEVSSPSPSLAPASLTDSIVSGESVQAAAAPVIIPAAPTVTTNGLLRFTSQVEFETAFPGLPKEDFEESPVAAGVPAFCDRIDSTTNVAGAFAPGDILEGLALEATGTARAGCPGQCTMVVVGSGLGGWAPASISISTYIAGDPTGIVFTGVNAVGFDLTGSLAENATINVYSASGLLDTLTVAMTTTTQTFTGIYSTQPITRIDISSANVRVVDNIQFGAIPSNLTFYTSQAAFTTAHPGLPVEDFEESMVTDTGILHFTGPLDSTSNIPGVFSPGDILPGLRINGATGNTMAALGGNYTEGVTNFGNTTKVVLVNSIPDGMRLDFTNYDAYAVGMDLMRAWNPGNVIIAVYGPHGILLGATTRMIQFSETFVGVYSNQPITRIEVLESTDVVFVDNIRFGGSPAGLTFYNSQASFLAARPGLRVEDFEESTATLPTGCDEPVNSTANLPNCFVPGDILPGIAFQTVEKDRTCSVGGCPMAVVPSGWYGATSYMIGPDNFVQNLEITFAKKNVRYFGTDAMVILFGPADMLFSVYDDHDNFLGSALRNIGPTPEFLGVISTKHIARITITNPGSATELIDNVRFGAFPWQTIIPAISGH